MNKKMFSLIGLLSLAVAAVPFAVRGEAKQAKAEGETPITIFSVSNQNIAGGYGLGIALIAEPYTSGSYWVGVTVSEGAKLYNPYGEVSATCWEEVGNQMCINRVSSVGGASVGHNNYNGYVLEIDEGTTFNFATGNKYIASTTQYWVCKLPNGTVSGDWDVYGGTSTIEGLESSYEVEMGKTVTLAATVQEDANALLFYKSANESVATVSATGVINPVSVGTTTVSVYSGLNHVDVSVTVKAAAVAQSGIRVKTKTVQTYKGYAYDWSKLQVVGLYGEAEGAAIAVTESMISGTYDINTVGDYELTVTSGDFSDTFTLQVVDVPAATVHAEYFGAGSPWGSQFYFNVNELTDVGQYIQFTGSSAEMANASAHLEYNDSPLELTYYRNCGGSRIELYHNVATPSFGDKMTIKAGFPIYKYSGNMSGTFVDAGDGEYYVAAELKQDYVYVWTGAAWEYNPDAAVQAFVDTYMHMSHVENDGSCTTEGWYTAAKAAVASLSDYARMLLASESKYADAYSRLVKWAEVNGETLAIDDFDGTLSVSSNNGINVLNSNATALITIVAAMSCVALLGTALIIRKKKSVR